MSTHASWDDEDEKSAAPKKAMWFEFDCPTCNANNPWPDGFKEREEVNCHYCGTSFEARLSSDNKLKLREI
jgi:transcription elongation factor Elf1